jgi:hypothetical protein
LSLSLRSTKLDSMAPVCPPPINRGPLFQSNDNDSRPRTPSFARKQNWLLAPPRGHSCLEQDLPLLQQPARPSSMALCEYSQQQKPRISRGSEYTARTILVKNRAAACCRKSRRRHLNASAHHAPSRNVRQQPRQLWHAD